MRAPFVSSVNWPGSPFPASPGRWAPAPTRCSSFCFYLGVIYRCAARNLSALAKGSLVHRVSTRRPPPPFQKPLASSQGRVTPKSRGVPGENAEGQKHRWLGGDTASRRRQKRPGMPVAGRHRERPWHANHARASSGPFPAVPHARPSLSHGCFSHFLPLLQKGQ